MRKESTISFMHRGFISMLAILAVLCASCSSDGDLINDGGAADGGSANGTSGLTADAHDKEVANLGTRSSLTYNSGSNTTTFKWDSNDKLTVFAEDNDMAKQIYSINYKAEYDNRAHFSSSDFSLTKDKRYFAISKAEGDVRPGVARINVPDQRNITFDYSGQKQTGNASTAHLGFYDLMATSAICEEENQLHFDFQHLGATMRMVLMKKDGDTDFPNIEFTQLEIYSSDNNFRQPERILNLNSGVMPDGSYSPALQEPDLSSSKRFTIDLTDGSGHGITPKSNFNDGSGPNTYKDLVVYMEIPPFNFSGKTIGLILHGRNTSLGKDVTYYSTHTGFNVEQGKVYNAYYWANPTTDYTVTLKIDHKWKYGTDKDVTRAGTGDPGYDKEFVQPNHLYYIFCVGGKVRAVQDISGTGDTHAVNHIAVSGTAPDSWSFDKENKISTYGKMLTFPTTDDDRELKKQLFVIAANRALAETAFSGLADQDPISEVLELAYNITGTQEVSQVFLRDLYSTPYDTDANFVGNLNDPMQDVFLYHTAAKVDLKWNSATQMSITSPNNEIKVNTVKNSGLSLFKPTTNTNTSGSYTVTTPITTGTMYNGRQVYYLPQFSNDTYNVTIGTKTSDILFKETSTDGGFTSWLRALIKQ